MSKIYVTVLGVLMTTISFAQEICNNCIDDDNDGLIDCYDLDCSGDQANCPDFYLYSLDDQGGSAITNCNTTFGMELLYIMPGSFPFTTPKVGDINNDGIVEIMGYEHTFVNNDLLIMNGKTGAIDTISYMEDVKSNVFADVDGDLEAEFFSTYKNSLGEYRLVRMEWNSSVFTWDVPLSVFADKFSLAIADFNGDGEVEVYQQGEIYNANTGELLISDNTNETYSKMRSVAMDILPDEYCSNCQGLELINGNKIFSVDIDNNVLSKEVEIASYSNPTYTITYAVADMNLDGELDLILMKSIPSSNIDSLEVYDPRTQLQLKSTFTYTGYIGDRLPEIAIGNLDIDPFPEISILFDKLVTIDNDLSLMATSQPVIRDTMGTIGYVGDQSFSPNAITLFDFNCDGVDEVIAQGDNGYIDIVDAATGQVLAFDTCYSRTVGDKPVVADVNGDGHAELLCGCGDGLKVWSGINNSWSSARSIWNQVDFYNVHINDDLTVPLCQKSMSASILNKYSATTGIYTSMGTRCESIDTPFDISLIIDTFEYINCDSALLKFSICNNENDLFDSIIQYEIYTNLFQQNPVLITSGATTDPLEELSCEKFILKVATDQRYYIYVEDQCNIDNAFDDIYIPLAPELLIEPLDTSNICNEGKLTLTINEVELKSVVWSTGDTTPSITIDKIGGYSFSAELTNGCIVKDTGFVIDTCSIAQLFIPNALNEQNNLKIYHANITNYTLNMYNRYGGLIYTKYLDDLTNSNSTEHEVFLNTGVYIFNIQYSIEQGGSEVKSGTLTVLK